MADNAHGTIPANRGNDQIGDRGAALRSESNVLVDWRNYLETALTASHSLDVPGARLYYEVRGAGPLLMLVGHPMGTAGFAAIALLLAKHFTVVTYDPRGFPRSTIDDRDQDAEPDLLADDVHQVLEAVGGGPAYVFGSSGGAVTGLALVARYPEDVQTLVAHEPPLALLLPEAEEARSELQEIYATYQASGIGPAWQRFSSFSGIDMAPQSESPASQPPSPDMTATSQRFFAHSLFPIALYRPDFSALQAAPTHVIPAGGMTSRGQFAWRTAAVLAERLGTALVEFPGGHGGFISHAKDFAPVLMHVLA